MKPNITSKLFSATHYDLLKKSAITRYSPDTVPQWRAEVTNMAIMLGASHFLGRIYTTKSYTDHHVGNGKLFDSAVKAKKPDTKTPTRTKSERSKSSSSSESSVVKPSKDTQEFKIEIPSIQDALDTKLCPNLADLSMADSYLEDLVSRHKIFYYGGWYSSK